MVEPSVHTSKVVWMSIKRTLCCLATSALFSAAILVISALGIDLGLGVGRISVRSKTDLVTLCRAAVSTVPRHLRENAKV